MSALVVDLESWRLCRQLEDSLDPDEYRAAARHERVIAAEHTRNGRHHETALCLMTAERHDRMARAIGEKAEGDEG